MASTRANVADGRQATWTRDKVLEALREYAGLYGDDFPASAFSPASAKRNGRPDLVDRYYTERPSGGHWPSLNVIKEIAGDGSFNAARAAIGLPANTTGPARGRRKAGEAEPILHVRERIRYVSDERLDRATLRARRAEDRELTLRAKYEALKDEVVSLRSGRREVVVREAAPVVKTKTKTVTKTVKVKDTRALERLRMRLADSEAARRAVEDQLRAEQRDRNREKTRVAQAEVEVIHARERIASAEAEAKRAADRLVASERLTERLRAEVEDARADVMGVTEAALVTEAVQHAEARADRAEVRAARAEREMAEQAAAITGELRKLTADELAELRDSGPAGPEMLKRALARFALARKVGGNEPMRAALTDLARAAVNWRDRLR